MKYLEAKKLTDEGENKALGGPGENKARGRGVSAVTPNAGPPATGPNASPQARVLAKEQNIDLAKLTGTGAGGIITAGDVRQAIEEKGRQD